MDLSAGFSVEDFWCDRHLQVRHCFVTLEHPDSYYEGDVVVYSYVSSTQTNHSHRGKQ